MTTPGSESGEVLYCESVGYSWWLLALILLPTVIFGAVFLGALFLSKPGFAAVYGIVLIVLLAFDVNFWRLSFMVTESEVSFGFGLVKKTFPRSSIASCEPYTLTWHNYWGYGIRWGRDGTLAYNTRNGPGIKLVVEGAKRPYVVSIDGPEEACGLIAGRAEPPETS